jgi:hypothetical protein
MGRSDKGRNHDLSFLCNVDVDVDDFVDTVGMKLKLKW